MQPDTSKRTPRLSQTAAQVREVASEIRWLRHKPSLYLFIGLCLNLLVAPLVYAASSNDLSRNQAWALGILGLGTVALAVYLFFVMFAPERF